MPSHRLDTITKKISKLDIKTLTLSKKSPTKETIANMQEQKTMQSPKLQGN